jgi:hypothetical protein
LKERFGEKGESSREGRREEDKSKERIKIGVTIEEQDSVVTSKEVVREPTLAVLDNVKYPTRLDMIWPPNAIPQIKESHPKEIGTHLGLPNPLVQSSNLVNCTINSPIIFIISPHSSPTSSSGRNSISVAIYLVYLQITHPIPEILG